VIADNFSQKEETLRRFTERHVVDRNEQSIVVDERALAQLRERGREEPLG
jgi:hypothetical protein